MRAEEVARKRASWRRTKGAAAAAVAAAVAATAMCTEREREVAAVGQAHRASEKRGVLARASSASASASARAREREREGESETATCVARASEKESGGRSRACSHHRAKDASTTCVYDSSRSGEQLRKSRYLRCATSNSCRRSRCSQYDCRSTNERESATGKTALQRGGTCKLKLGRWVQTRCRVEGEGGCEEASEHDHGCKAVAEELRGGGRRAT
eukprot:2251678-Pleurochrysis_carterae.AAC.1